MEYIIQVDYEITKYRVNIFIAGLDGNFFINTLLNIAFNKFITNTYTMIVKLANKLKDILNVNKDIYIYGDSFGGFVAMHLLFIFRYLFRYERTCAIIFGGLNGLPKNIYDNLIYINNHILYYCHKKDNVSRYTSIIWNFSLPNNFIEFDDYIINYKPNNNISYVIFNLGEHYLSFNPRTKEIYEAIRIAFQTNLNLISYCEFKLQSK